MPDFSDNPDFYNNLMNFGFATMAAGAQPGARTLGAIGAGGMGMNDAAAQRAQMQSTQQDVTQKRLGNALSLRQLNMGNIGLGLPTVQMNGIPDFMPQQTQQPTAGGAYGSTSSTAGQPSPNTNQTTKPTGAFGFEQSAVDVALGRRAPQNLDEVSQAAAFLSRTGLNPVRQKQLEELSSKQLEPQNLREGSTLYNPMTGGNVTSSKNVAGYNNKNQPIVASYTPGLSVNGNQQGGGQRNVGQGARNTHQGSGSEIRTGFSPEEEQTQKNFFGPEQAAYQGAQGAKYHFQFLRNDLDTVNAQPNFLTSGAGANWRMDFAKHANLVSNGVFGVSMFDPEKVAAGESLFKETGRLGFDMSKQLGAREPGVITQMAIKLNPGMDNTPQGAQLIVNSLEEGQQRLIDERAYKEKYYQENGYHQTKAETTFDSKYKPELYAKRAMSLVNPIKINNPKEAKNLLAGTAILRPDGTRKLVPANFGVTPPSLDGSLQPVKSLPVELNGQTEEE